MKIKYPENRKVRIEIVPLIDVMFLILVFFIYGILSMAIHRGLNIKLPISKTAEIQKKEHISISINQDKTIYINKNKTDLEQISLFLGSANFDRDSEILLFADRNITYQLIFDVLDQVKKSGFTRISLQAKRD